MAKLFTCGSVIFLVGLFLFFLVVLTSQERENYGPVKRVSKIPMTDCYENCKNWTENCIQDRPGDEQQCKEMYVACQEGCYYTNYQRQ